MSIPSIKAAIGKPAPSINAIAVDKNGIRKIKLSDYAGKYVVLFFWPRDFTFVCPTELIAFSDRVEEFRSSKCEIVGCSTDSHYTHLAWTKQSRKEGGLGEMKFPMISDPGHHIARAYGVLKEDEGLAFRGLFIIDTKGIVRNITVNDLPVGRDIDETLRLVKAFQCTDGGGEICPPGWIPGGKSIKTIPNDPMDFFEKYGQKDKENDTSE